MSEALQHDAPPAADASQSCALDAQNCSQDCLAKADGSPGSCPATVSLDTLRPGCRGCVSRISTMNPELARRLLSFGIVTDSLVEVLGVAPLGDPIQIRANRTQLSLRKSEARAIIVEQP